MIKNIEYLKAVCSAVGKFSIFYGNKEIIRNLEIKEMFGTRSFPPYDHVVIPFYAHCREIDIVSGGDIIYSGNIRCVAKIDKYNIPVYIDSFARDVIQGSVPFEYIPLTREFVIYGHFDDRDFNEIVISEIEGIREIEERIESRFDILDFGD